MSKLTPLRLLTALIVVLVGFFIYTLDFFEDDPPIIEPFIYVNPTTEIPLDDVSAWNPSRKIAIYATDESGIKSYKIKVTTSDGLVVLEKEEVIINKPKSTKIWLPKPEIDLPNGTLLYYDVSITDWSNAHFFNGNTIKKQFALTINTQKPIINILANSYKITYGGSALVIFKISSIDIKELKVSNGRQLFTPFPLFKKGYYAVILAWPIQNSSFVGTISATDSALNSQKITIPLIRNNSIRYTNSTIKLKEEFLNTKMDSLIKNLGRSYPESIQDNFEKFRYINETVRLEDEEIITRAAIQDLDSQTTATSMPLWHHFVPLKGYVNVGKFGDKRTYISPNNQKSLSVHLGVDIASVKNDKIYSSNNGKVVLARQLGVYGRTLLINHGFGLSTLYSHLEQFNVAEGEEIGEGSILGLTGQTGWAFGDHLHFGVLIQGLPVRSAEWVDAKWIQTNITDVFEKARTLIELSE